MQSISPSIPHSRVGLIAFYFEAFDSVYQINYFKSIILTRIFYIIARKASQKLHIIYTVDIGT